ncbi:hypothetical protein GCM10009646_61070 [Streptomyces aureus]
MSPNATLPPAVAGESERIRASRSSRCPFGAYLGHTPCCGPEAIEIDDNFGSTLYAEDERDTLPAEALAASLGCGNPTAVADLHEGERVLDLGSGGGIDVLLSARRVGPTGKAHYRTEAACCRRR